MYQKKWYLSTWFILLNFSISLLFTPYLIAGFILFTMQIIENKKIKKQWMDNGFGDTIKIRQNLEKMNTELVSMESTKESLKLEIDKLREVKNEKMEEIVDLDDEISLQSVGFYKTKYEFSNSEKFMLEIDKIRNKQKNMVKDRKATKHNENWKLEGSLQKGKVMNNNNIKLTLNSFNNECDVVVSKVTFSNISSMEKRIRKSFDNLNKMNKQNQIEIKKEYLGLKLDELYLCYEYQQKKEEEKELERERRERLKEEEKVKKEIEAAKLKIEKEEKHFKQEIKNLQSRLENSSDSAHSDLLAKIKELEDKLVLVEKDKENVFKRDQNTRAGYVYIISNIGSFGENVFKIGMTRRLEPMDRVKELGDASVPFTFDVHTLIFSEDAPSLENTLHKTFHHKRVNRINERKEFFNVTLSEIEEIVKTHHNNVVSFVKKPEAQDYRQTLLLNSHE